MSGNKKKLTSFNCYDFSDMIVQLKDGKIPGHQLVFAARNIHPINGVLGLYVGEEKRGATLM